MVIGLAEALEDDRKRLHAADGCQHKANERREIYVNHRHAERGARLMHGAELHECYGGHVAEKDGQHNVDRSDTHMAQLARQRGDRHGQTHGRLILDREADAEKARPDKQVAHDFFRPRKRRAHDAAH